MTKTFTFTRLTFPADITLSRPFRTSESGEEPFFISTNERLEISRKGVPGSEIRVFDRRVSLQEFYYYLYYLLPLLPLVYLTRILGNVDRKVINHSSIHVNLLHTYPLEMYLDKY